MSYLVSVDGHWALLYKYSAQISRAVVSFPGWVGSIAYATGIALVLKLIASAMQQKLIGENLSGYVSVRQFVGINSTFMKAMRILLSQPGLSVAKVAILSCGPGAYLSWHGVGMFYCSLNLVLSCCIFQ